METAGQAAAADGQLVRDMSMPLYQSKGWIKLVGVLMIVYGVLIALSIIGIVVAWLPIWLGVLLFQSANAIEQAQQQGDREAMLRSLGKLKVYFVILGVLTLIGLILSVLGFFMGFTAGFMGVMQSMPQ
ncbi:MAG: DUF5362 domain-containing protein [Gammaproteobacteria bacterium]|nr:DUF5362 domain-containing protein [Gammaproteobacteria bacterium]